MICKDEITIHGMHPLQKRDSDVLGKYLTGEGQKILILEVSCIMGEINFARGSTIWREMSHLFIIKLLKLFK